MVMGARTGGTVVWVATVESAGEKLSFWVSFDTGAGTAWSVVVLIDVSPGVAWEVTKDEVEVVSTPSEVVDVVVSGLGDGASVG